MVVASIPAGARAEDRPLAAAISVASPDVCLEPDAVVAHVGSWLDRDVISSELGVVVEGDGDAVSFVVTRDGAPIATRRFDRLPPVCADRRAAIALAIALAIDAAILESLGITPAVAVEHAEAPTDAPTPAPSPPSRAPPGERAALSIEAEALVLVEVLPDVALAGAVAVAWVIGGGVRLRVGVLATQRAGIAIATGAAELSLVAARLDGCYGRTVASGLLLGGCVGVASGVAMTQGRDFAVVFAPLVPWTAAAVRAELRWLPWDVLALTLAAEGVFSLVRPRLQVTDGVGGLLDSRTLPAAGLAIAIGAALVIE